MPPKTASLRALVLALATAAPCFAAHVSEVDMVGVRIRNGLAIDRARLGITLDAAFVYSVETIGEVVGMNGALAVAFPNATPVGDALNVLAPGSATNLFALGGNVAGTVGVTCPPFTASGQSTIEGIPTTFAMTMNRTVDPSGHAGILIFGVTLNPVAQVGFLEFTSGVTRFTARCHGDANGDNAINFADLNILLSQFGQSSGSGASLRAGDVNGDGVVNFADLNMVLANFGAPCPA